MHSLTEPKLPKKMSSISVHAIFMKLQELSIS